MHNSDATLSFSRTAVRALIEFSQRVADTSEPADILPLLVDAVTAPGGVDAAAAFAINEMAELRQVAARGLPDSLTNIEVHSATIGDDLAKSLLDASGGAFATAHTFPFINDGQLYGALVVFLAPAAEFGESEYVFLEQAVQFAAAALRKANQYALLESAFRELQASQDVLLRTQKLRSLGQMSAGISHDLKNLLTPLFTYVDVLKRTRNDPDTIEQVADRMRTTLQRGLDTVERLRDFSRQSPETSGSTTVDINHLLHEAAEISRPRLGTVELQIELGKPPSVSLSSSDFVSAIVNMLFNALDAMQSSGQTGGTISIRSGESDDGGWIRVTDSGPGIPNDIKQRIFEPFFTTKGKDGTGLGLSMVYAFTQRHHGKLTVDSEPGKGTAFTLWFPATSAQA